MKSALECVRFWPWNLFLLKGSAHLFQAEQRQKYKSIFLCYWCCCFLYKNKWTLEVPVLTFLMHSCRRLHTACVSLLDIIIDPWLDHLSRQRAAMLLLLLFILGGSYHAGGCLFYQFGLISKWLRGGEGAWFGVLSLTAPPLPNPSCTDLGFDQKLLTWWHIFYRSWRCCTVHVIVQWY